MTKILVVDDEPDVELLIRQKFAKQLKSKEFDFVFASNGIEALKTLASHQDINIILTDINMPEMDGLTLLSNLHELKRIYKAVIISAYGDMSNIRKAMNQGACDFITKPIDFNDLQITILNAIEQYLAIKRSVEIESKLTDIEKELNVAHNIQQSIIPHYFDPYPNNKNFAIYGTMIPAKEVGGDFFDFFTLNDHHLGFLISDVSGKSISAALFMAMSRATIRSVAHHTSDPHECLKEANLSLCKDNITCTFVTTFYGIYDTLTGEVVCANAGHNPPFLVKANGSIEEIARNEGVALGVIEDSIYKTHQFKMEKGDTLVLYTDGVTEAMNGKKELYTEARFLEILKKAPELSLEELIANIKQDVENFEQGVPSSDDITLLCLRHQ